MDSTNASISVFTKSNAILYVVRYVHDVLMRPKALQIKTNTVAIFANKYIYSNTQE